MISDLEPERLPYSPDKFVDRTDELLLVIDKAKRLVGGSFEEKRVVIFHGARGSGKSWLLHEIARQLETTLSKALCVYLDLLTFKPSSGNPVREIIKQIRGTLLGPGGIPLPDDVTPDQCSNLLAEAAKGSNRVLVALFDHVDESPVQLLEPLEDRCLASLAVSPKVLIVLAGRGKEYTWTIPHLRLKSEELDLECFDLSCTQQQLEKQVPHPIPAAEDVWKLSGGYPWSNYILAVRYGNRPAALNQCAEILLSNLPVHATNQDISRLKALCILRSFSDEMIPPMLSTYFDDPSYLEWRYREYRRVRQTLTTTTLVKWDESEGGYVVDEALRCVLEGGLYEDDRATWQRLHKAARDLFEDWKAEYPRTAHRWQEKMDYHEGKLANGPLWMPQDEEGEKR